MMGMIWQVWSVSHWDEFLPMFERIKQRVLLKESFSNPPVRELIREEYCESDGSGNLDSQLRSWFEVWAAGLDPVRRTSFETWAANLNGRQQSEVVATSSDIQAQGMSRDDSVSSSCGSLMKNDRISGTGILVVVDLALAPDSLEEVFLALEGGLPQTSAMVRVVWLLTANTPGAALLRLKRKKGAIACHLVLHKPLHGSRLQSLWNQVELLVKSKDIYAGTSMVGPASDSGEIRAGPQSPWQPVLASMNESHMDSTSDTENSRAAENIDIVSRMMLHRQSSRDLSTSLNPREDIATCLENRSDSKEIGEDIHPKKDLASVVAMQVASTGSVASTDVNLVIPSKRGTRESEIMGPADSLAGMHILVAEDNRVLQKLTKTMLLRLGATVVCVDNGAEAAQLVLANLPRPLGSLVSYGSLKKRADSKGEVHEDEQVQVQVSTVKPRPFDLVLMDCQMPVLDGYGATQRIREQERQMGWHTPVIALTAHAMAKDESKCIEAGMDFYLTKPLATKALLAVAAELNSSR
jgi:CheY-like chemotaxis protein